MHIVILVTAKDEAQAQRIAEKLVAEKLVACAQHRAGDSVNFPLERQGRPGARGSACFEIPPPAFSRHRQDR